jgi:hypothetical protein
MRCFHAEEMAFGGAGLLVALSSPLRPATQPLQKEELSCGRRAALPCKAPEQNGFLVNSGTRKIEKRPRSPDGPKLREKERANVRRSLAYADNKSISVDQIRVVSGRWYTYHQGSSLPASRWCKCALKFGLAASCITADPLKKYDFVFAQKSGTALHPERNNAVPTALGRLLISSPSRWVWARQYRLG